MEQFFVVLLRFDRTFAFCVYIAHLVVQLLYIFSCVYIRRCGSSRSGLKAWTGEQTGLICVANQPSDFGSTNEDWMMEAKE